MTTSKLLALSGGGAMGESQAQVLYKLELEANKPLWQNYKLIAGSSVGAIHAAIIGSGRMSMERLSIIEEEMLTKIFSHKRMFPNFYKTDVFIDIWNSIIGSDLKFGDMKTRVMISSVEKCTNRTVFFKSWEEKDANLKLIDVVMRSFAAPLFFGQINVPSEQRVYTDGGCGASNLPLEAVRFEAELEGWYLPPGFYEQGRKIFIDAVGALFIDDTTSYKDAANDRPIRQVFDFIAPSEGGMARIQSRTDQIRKIQKLATVNKNVSFRYWDYCIPEKFDGMDKIKYLHFYKDCGKTASKKPLIEILNP